jgi:hypothetical protein
LATEWEDLMSRRNRPEEGLEAAKAEQRAHAKAERHRVNTELHTMATAVQAGTEPEDTVEPGPAWRPVHHHSSEKAKAKLASSKRRRRHWKMKAWKRRTQVRRAKAIAHTSAPDLA